MSQIRSFTKPGASSLQAPVNKSSVYETYEGIGSKKGSGENIRIPALALCCPGKPKVHHAFLYEVAASCYCIRVNTPDPGPEDQATTRIPQVRFLCSLVQHDGLYTLSRYVCKPLNTCQSRYPVDTLGCQTRAPNQG